MLKYKNDAAEIKLNLKLVISRVSANSNLMITLSPLGLVAMVEIFMVPTAVAGIISPEATLIDGAAPAKC